MPAGNRRCGFSLPTYLRDLLLAAISLILMVAVFIFYSQSNINVAKTFSFRGIAIIVGHPACYCFIAAFIVTVVHLQLLPGWNAILAYGFIRYFMPEYWRGESPDQREETVQRTDSTRNTASTTQESLILARRQRRHSEDVRLYNEYGTLPYYPIIIPLFRGSRALAIYRYPEYIYNLKSGFPMIAFVLPPRRERQELRRTQSDSNLQSNVHTRLPISEIHDINRMLTQLENIVYSQRRTGGKQQTSVVKSEEAHLRQRKSRVHRRSLLRRECASTAKEQIDPQQCVLSGSSRARQKETESNVNYQTSLFSAESRELSPEIASEQLHGSRVQRSERPTAQEQESGVHLPRQIPDITRNIRGRLRQSVLSGSRTRQRQTESNALNSTPLSCVGSRDESPEIVSEQLHGSQERPTTQSLCLQPWYLIRWDQIRWDQIRWDLLSEYTAPWLLSELPRTRRETESNVFNRTPFCVGSRDESPEVFEWFRRSLRECLATQEQEIGLNLPGQIPDIPLNIGRRLRPRRSSSEDSCQGQQNKTPKESSD